MIGGAATLVLIGRSTPARSRARLESSPSLAASGNLTLLSEVPFAGRDVGAIARFAYLARVVLAKSVSSRFDNRSEVRKSP